MAEGKVPSWRAVTAAWLWPILAALLVVSASMMISRPLAIDTLRGFAAAVHDKVEVAYGSGQVRQNGPPVVVARFDSATTAMLKGDPNGLVTPRSGIAKLLDRVRADRSIRAKLVIVDINLLAITDVAGNSLLSASLYRWRDDPHAPPLGLYAGAACLPGEGGRYFDPSEFPATTLSVKDQRIWWVCPVYDGSAQKLWTCVDRFSPGVGRSADRLALVSPALLAIAARPQGLSVLQKLEAQASHSCAGAENSSLVDQKAIVPLIRGGDEALKNLQISARPVLDERPASTLLQSDADLSFLDESILVVAGSPLFNDIQIIDDASYSGPALVGMSSRDFFNNGIPSKPNVVLEWLSAFFLAILTFAVLRSVESRKYDRLQRLRGFWRFFAFVAVQEQLIVALIFALLLSVFGSQSFNTLFIIGVAFLAVEAMLLMQAKRREWDAKGLGS